MTPSHLYRDKLQSGLIEQDTAQLSVLPVLDDVFVHLITPQTPPKKGLFSFLHKPPKRAGGGLYIWGDVGRGKTMLMDVFFHALPDTMRKRRVHFHAFMLEVQSRLKRIRADHAAHDFLGEVAGQVADEADVFCFDEFHVTDIADAMILGPLFTALFARGVFVVATSNWAPENLYKDGLQRDRFLPFIATIRAQMQVVHLNSPTDHRRKTLLENGVYRTDGGAGFRDLFAHLTAGFPADAGHISVQGRDVPAHAMAADIGWFSFDMLCKQARGASDYIAVCESCAVILVDGVPAFDDARRDWAKRFMTLVDVAYDARRVLVLGAAVPIDALYSGSMLAFEFQRTQSRLQEMQHPDWFAHIGAMLQADAGQGKTPS